MAQQNPRVLVFIPTYNDFEVLGSVIDAVHAVASDCHVLVVDDGSTNGTDLDLGSRRDLLFVRLPANFGLGVCTLVAFDHLKRHGYDVLVRVDADGQHVAADIPRLLQPIVTGVADLVVGCRTNRAANHGPREAVRDLVRRYYAFVGSLLTRGRTPADLTTGFFAANVDAVAKLSDPWLERYPEPELYIRACRIGLRLVGIEIEQSERKFGISTLTLVQALRMLFRFNLFVIEELIGR